MDRRPPAWSATSTSEAASASGGLAVAVRGDRCPGVHERPRAGVDVLRDGLGHPYTDPQALGDHDQRTQDQAPGHLRRNPPPPSTGGGARALHRFRFAKGTPWRPPMAGRWVAVP